MGGSESFFNGSVEYLLYDLLIGVSPLRLYPLFNEVCSKLVDVRGVKLLQSDHVNLGLDGMVEYDLMFFC